jgi:hypothetical protein
MKRGILSLGIVSVILTFTGCIFVSEREYVREDYGSTSRSKVPLSSDQRQSLPTVSSTAELPTVQTRFADRIRALNVDTTVDQFRAAFPESYFVERRNLANGAVDAYAVNVDETFRYRSTDFGYRARDERWFYFRDGRYVKLGGRQEWPN